MTLLRPREKLHRYGAASLTDAELLAIFLRTGVNGIGVEAFSESLLRHFGSLYELMSSEKEAWLAIHGIGIAKMAQILAVTELARRFFLAQFTTSLPLEDTQATRQFLASQLAQEEREIFMVIFLDNQHRVISVQKMFSGSLDCVEVHPREILREALKVNAAALILAHNHPSGMAEPSEADKAVTLRVKNACLLLNIRLLDHMVIGKGRLTSFAERGLI